MDTLEAIITRRSIRRFTDEPVSEDVLRELAVFASMAPSINNCQPWRFVAITNPKTLRELATIVSDKIDELFPDALMPSKQTEKTQIERLSTFFAQTPAVIAITHGPYAAEVDTLLEKSEIDREELNDMRRFPNLQSVGAAVQNLLLAAHAKGLGGCWLSGMMLARSELEERLSIEAPYSLTSFVAIGHPAHTPEPAERIAVEELLRIAK